MSAGAVLLGFLNVALTCAIIIFIAAVIVWVLRWMGVAIDVMVYKWGQIIVGLLCLIVIVGWLLSLLGGGVGYAPHFLGRW
jgi:hypothetical protein